MGSAEELDQLARMTSTRGVYSIDGECEMENIEVARRILNLRAARSQCCAIGAGTGQSVDH